MDVINGNRGIAGVQAKGFELKGKLQAYNTMVVPMLGLWRSEWS